MAADSDKKYVKSLIGKTVVSKSGKKFGEVGNISFEVKSGELINLVLKNPTVNATKLDLEKDQGGNLVIPFSAVIAMGDYLVVSEEDVV